MSERNVQTLQEITLELDLINTGCRVEAKRGDKASRFLLVRLTSSGNPWTPPTGARADLRYRKRNGKGGMLSAVINADGTITAELAQALLSTVGLVTADICITGAAGELLSSTSFYIHVGDVPLGEGADDPDRLQALADMVTEAQRAIADLKKIGFRVNGKWLQFTTDGASWENLLNTDEIVDPEQLVAGADGFTIVDGLLYLTKDGQIIASEHNGIEIPTGSGAGGGLAFDSGYTDEAGYLHLTLNGEDIQGFEPFWVGSGGGGGGSDYGSTIKITTSLESRIFSVMDSEETCLIPYNWTSVDSDDGGVTGSGTASWSVNGTRVAVGKVEQGDNVFDVRPYLNSGEENSVLLTIYDAYGGSKNMSFVISVVSYGLSWNLPEMAFHDDAALKISLTPTGTGIKTIYVTVDGSTVYDGTVATTNRAESVTVPAQVHGAHVIEAWLETTVAGETIVTDRLRHVGLWRTGEDGTTIVGVYRNAMSVGQYGTAQVKFMVVNPLAETADVALQVDGTTVTALSGVDRTVQTWAYKARTVGTETLRVLSGGVYGDVLLTVSSLGYDINPITAGLVLDIDPSGHSNSEAGRANFGYLDGDGVNHPFTFSPNFDWNNGGFQLDADGVTAFVVKRGTYVMADRTLFADNAKVNGEEIKIIFKSTNVRNYDAVLLDCMSGNVGLKLQAQQATVGSEAETMTIPYCEERLVEMDINIEPTSDNRLAMVYLQGVPSCPPVCYNATDSWIQSAAKVLTIGSEDADVWLYRMKVYGNALNRFEILDNYIADCGSTEEMVARYERNDIYNDDGTISISKLTAKNPELRAIHIKAKRMTTGKKDNVSADIEVIRQAGGEEDHLIAKNAVFKAQGTSSLEYILAALNLDIDFSKAESWTNGLGTAVTEYAFSKGAIPVSYFNLKADVASSEMANNVCLADDYNTYNPTPFAGKSGGVRDCIEGHPCAVFFTNTDTVATEVGSRTVAPGETILYFAGNMNNSKKNVKVFGQDNAKWPRQCCVEVLNNISNQCRFRSDDLTKETWDGAEGTSNFEFRFPEAPTAEMKAKFQEMLSWVVSTNRELAPGTALPAAQLINGVAYSNDNAAYRGAKFLAELDSYFVRDQLLFHFLFTERHGMVDNRSKNLFLSYDYYEDIGDYRWSVRCNYDNDTAEGCDNSGGATFTYGLELHDMVGDSYAFNAHDNTLWVNISDLMQDDLLRVFVSNKDAWDRDRILRKFREYQGITPEAVRSEDAWNKYMMPLLLKGEDAYLKRCHGPKTYWREQYETYQDIYVRSEYCDTTDRANCVSFRATISDPRDGDFTITPFSRMYVAVQYGTNSLVRIKAERNVPLVIACPTDTLGDTEGYIFSASNLVSLGDISKLKTKFVTLTQAQKLQDLLIGSGEAGYQNLNMTSLGLGNNTLIEVLDIRGLPNLTGLLDLSALTSLEEFYGNGSGLTGLILAPQAPLRTARVPAVGSFSARDLDLLEDFSMDGSKLLSLRVENCPGIDSLALCKAATGLTRGRLIGVSWSDGNADVLTRLAGLRENGGMDAQGEIIDGFVLTGSAYCEVITQEEIETIHNAFPELLLSYGSVVETHTATFRNWDGTHLCEVTVRHGAAAPNPVTAGIIGAPVRESTVEQVYTFVGWDAALDSIVADVVFTAQFTAGIRYYTVNYWYDTAESQKLETHSVPANGSCQYGGATLDPPGDALWLGWDVLTNKVVSDMEVHALFVTPELPDGIPAEFDYLYSMDPADKSAYTASQFYGILYYGRERDYFALGDRIKMVCDTDNFTDTVIILELRSFKHFKSAEGRVEWAGPYFGMVGLMTASCAMNATNKNAGGFPDMTMINTLNNSVFTGLPQLFKALIEKIIVLSSAGNMSADIVSAETYLTLESWAELGGDASVIPYCNEVAEGADEVALSCYSTNASRIKKYFNGGGEAAQYYTRSPLVTSNIAFIAPSTAGAYNYANAFSYYPPAFSFGFCLRSNLSTT